MLSQYIISNSDDGNNKRNLLYLSCSIKGHKMNEMSTFFKGIMEVETFANIHQKFHRCNSKISSMYIHIRSNSSNLWKIMHNVWLLRFDCFFVEENMKKGFILKIGAFKMQFTYFLWDFSINMLLFRWVFICQENIADTKNSYIFAYIRQHSYKITKSA